jgi:bacillithiol biosynthesis cysteine-adding enzyme BshC
VREYYARNPHDPTAPVAQAAALDARAYPRAAVSEILAEQNAGWDAGPATERNIARLTDPRALTVLTGQQTGLFVGPCFTLYKAATTVGVAAALERQLGRPVVPLFWMASEDHDLPEADHVNLLDAGHRSTMVRLARGEGAGFIPANLILGPDIQRALTDVTALFPRTEFTDDLLNALRRCYAPEETLASAFARWLAHLTREWGLVLIDPADPRLKALASPVLLGELRRAPATSQAIREVSGRLEARGYPAQIAAPADAASVFLLAEGRWPLRRTPQGLVVLREGQPVRLDHEPADPAALSPNVALRPVVQDSLFPSIAYIGGPAEVAYYAQLGPVYAAFGVPMPILFPRASLTLVEGRIGDLMARYALTLPQLRAEPEALVSAILRQGQAAMFEARMAEAKAAMARTFKEVEALVGEIDPTLQGPAAQAAGHTAHQLDGIQKKAIQALKRRHEDLRAHVHRVREHLMPRGRPQERVLGLLPFLARHGPGLTEVIRTQAADPGWTHRLVRLGSAHG